MTVGDQDHGEVSMSVAAVLAGIVHELFDLASGQIFPDCTVYSVWWGGIRSLIRHRKFRAVANDWEDNTLFMYSLIAAGRILVVMSDGIGDHACRMRRSRSRRRWHLALSRLPIPRTNRGDNLDHQPVRLTLG